MEETLVLTINTDKRSLTEVPTIHSYNVYVHPSDPWSFYTCCKSIDVTVDRLKDAVPATIKPPDEHVVEAYKYTLHEEKIAPLHAWGPPKGTKDLKHNTMTP